MVTDRLLILAILATVPQIAFGDGLSDLLRNRDDIRVQKTLTTISSKADAYKYEATTDERPYSSLKAPNYRVEMEKKNGVITRLSEIERETLKNGEPGAVWMSTHRFEDGKLVARTRCDGSHSTWLYGNTTYQGVSCLTVTPQFCARLKRVVKDLTQKDMKDFSTDLRACVDKLKNFTSHQLVGAGMIDRKYEEDRSIEEKALKAFQDRVIQGQSIKDTGSIRMFGDQNLEKGPTLGVQALEYFSAMHNGMEECMLLEKFNPDGMKAADQADPTSETPMILRKVKAAEGKH